MILARSTALSHCCLKVVIFAAQLKFFLRLPMKSAMCSKVAVSTFNVAEFSTAVLMHNNPYECSRLSFASLDVFIRAYNDLFFCHTLAISPVYISGAPPDVNGANARLLTLPCPQQCLCIFFKNMPTANAGDITAWLTSGSDKKMFMDGTPHEEREAFAHELIEKVVEVRQVARCYLVPERFDLELPRNSNLEVRQRQLCKTDKIL